MSTDLQTLLVFRKALGEAKDGMGMSRAMVKSLRESEGGGTQAARMLLLGFPLSAALKPLAEEGSEEVSMLASLITSAPHSSARLVGRNGEALGLTLERWAKARESRRLEERVLRFRSMITSGVLGGVTAMLATLGPLVGGLGFTSSPVPQQTSLIPEAAVMTAVSSVMLGLFMSGRSFYVNVAVSMGVFALVAAVASPLAGAPALSLWGVK